MSLFSIISDKIISLINFILSKYKSNILILIKRRFYFKIKIIFLVEDFDWVIRRVGSYIINNLKKENLINIEMDRRYVFNNKISEKRLKYDFMFWFIQTIGQIICS